jgi:hypothetical protein
MTDTRDVGAGREATLREIGTRTQAHAVVGAPVQSAVGEAADVDQTATGSGSDHWTFVVLMLLEFLFVFGLIRWAGMTQSVALWLATQATALAVVAIFAKPAVLSIGYRLRVTRLVLVPRSTDTPKVLIVAVLLELAVVLATICLTKTDPHSAVRLAGALTLLCMAATYGRPALLAISRRIFSATTDGD